MTYDKPFIYVNSESRNMSWGPFSSDYLNIFLEDEAAECTTDDFEVGVSPKFDLQGERCPACGLTEEQQEYLGYGGLIHVEIDIEPGEEMMAYTYVEEGYGSPIRICNWCFIELQTSLPRWLTEMFAKTNPAHWSFN